MPEARRGLLDTSVVIDIDTLDPHTLPDRMTVSALTLAELSAGPHATNDSRERSRRQAFLQRIEATFEFVPCDANVSRAYGRVYAAVVQAGRKARGPRVVDLLIAATALSIEVPLYTRNPADFKYLEGLLEVIAV